MPDVHYSQINHMHYYLLDGHVSVYPESDHYRAETKDYLICVDGKPIKGAFEAKSGTNGFVLAYVYDKHGCPVLSENKQDIETQRFDGKVEIRKLVGDLSVTNPPATPWVPHIMRKCDHVQ